LGDEDVVDNAVENNDGEENCEEEYDDYGNVDDDEEEDIDRC